MEFRGLREVLDGTGISATTFRQIALDLAASVAEHHDQSIVHSHLSPEAIFITPEGFVRIMGYGPVQPPELFDPTPDLQAMGRILYEMATGHPPSADHPDLHRVPPELQPIVAKALAGEYSSARQIGVDIRGLTQPPVVPENHPPRKYLWVVAALLLLATGVIWWRRGRITQRSNRGAVTVLFFANLSRDRSLDWLGRGVPDLLTTALQQSPNLEVISLERQVETLARRGMQLRALADPSTALDVARDSGADLAVSGAISREGSSRLVLEARLQDTSGGRPRKTFRAEAANAEELIKKLDEVASSLARELASPSNQAANPAGPSLEKLTTANPEALKSLLTGREMVRGFAWQEAAQQFDAALRLDPDSPLVHFEMSRIYARVGDPARRYESLLQAGSRLTRLPRYERLRHPVEMAELSGDPTALRQSLEAVVAAFPRDTASRNELALRLALSSNPQAAVKMVREGLDLDPDDPALLNQMVYATAMSGDSAAVRAASDRYRELHPEDLNAIDTRGEALYIVGDQDEALKAFRKLAAEKPDFLDYSELQKIALVLADQHNFEEAAELITEYERRASPAGQSVAPMYRARLAEAMDKPQEAAANYRLAVATLGAAGRTPAAGEALMSLANVAILSGGQNVAEALAFAKDQKLLGDELPATAWLIAASQRDAEAEATLKLYASARPWLSPARMSLLRAMNRTYAALARKDMAAARSALAGVPDESYPWLLYARGLAGDGEPAFRRALRAGSALFLPPPLESLSPLRQRLIREKLGIKETAQPSKGPGRIHL